MRTVNRDCIPTGLHPMQQVSREMGSRQKRGPGGGRIELEEFVRSKKKVSRRKEV